MKNSFKELLKSSKPVIGTFIQTGHSVITEFLSGFNFDFVVIDCEHSPISVTTTQSMLQSLNGSQTFGVVRVPYNNSSIIAQYLDAGADGIMVPQINNAMEAQYAIKSAFYPPKGSRGVGPGRAMGYGRLIGQMPDPDYRTTIILQVETLGAIEDIEQIVKLPGLDLVFIGPGDLSSALGVLGQFDNPELEKNISTIITVCAENQVPVGMFVSGAEMARKWLNQGVKILVVSSDLSFMASAANQLLDEIDHS